MLSGMERESSSMLLAPDWAPIVDRRVSGVKASWGGDGDRWLLYAGGAVSGVSICLWSVVCQNMDSS